MGVYFRGSLYPRPVDIINGYFKRWCILWFSDLLEMSLAEPAYHFSLWLSSYGLMSLLECEKQIRFFLSTYDSGIGEITACIVNKNQDKSGAAEPVKSSTPNKVVSRKRPINVQSKSTVIQKFVKPKIETQNLNASQTTDFQQNPADFVTATQILDSGKKSFQCKFCGYDYQERSKVVRHVSLKHITGGPEIKCTICDYSTRLKHHMKNHYTRRHQLPEVMAKAALN